MEFFKMSTGWATTVYIILAVFFVIFGVYREQLFKRQDSERTDKIMNLQETQIASQTTVIDSQRDNAQKSDQIIQLQTALGSKSTEIIDLQRELNKRSDQIIDLQKELGLSSRAIIEKTGLLEEIGKSHLKAIFYTEALNQQIGKVLLLIKLKNRMNFADLCPLRVAFGIWTRMPQKKIKSNFFIDSPPVRPGDRPVVSYSNYRIEDDGRLTGGHIRGTLQDEIDFFTVELDFPDEVGLLKDFHDEKLFVLMTGDMLERTSFIELIVDGWVILHKDIVKSHWRMDRGVSVEWPKFKYKEVEFYRNWNDDSGIGYSGWRIDLYNQIPFRYSSGVSRWPGF
ncbi:MAG: hypothetical protein M0Q01_14415 [Syntrophales bacterium]|jgi:hypothetical protein|nr:hypothetical protein [Syntrophales bacterium]